MKAEIKNIVLGETHKFTKMTNFVYDNLVINCDHILFSKSSHSSIKHNFLRFENNGVHVATLSYDLKVEELSYTLVDNDIIHSFKEVL